jgi:Rhs element Vgr protein
MASAGIASGGVVTFSVMVGGSAIPGGVNVLSVHVEKRVNRIPFARITILDGDASKGTFAASSSATFIPGATVSIQAGYDSNTAVIFTGIITNQKLRVDSFAGSTLEVECRDAAIKMIVGRKTLTYANQKDSDVISTIIGNYSGLSSTVTATDTQWPEQVQYYTSDWDYILSLAETNGMIVTVINSAVSVIKPNATTTSVLTVTYGQDLLEFNADLNSLTQLASVTASTWDYKNQAVSTGQATSGVAGPGNLSTETLSGVVGLSSYQLQTSAPLQAADLTNWSKAQVIKSEYAKIMGEAKFQGSNLVDPAKYMTFAGLGDRFNGDYLVSGVVHDLSQGNWITEVSLGLSPLWFTEEPDVMSPPASGILPGARGLFNGTVKQIAEDPDSQYRILVTVPLFDANGAGIWARLTNFYSTNGAGVFFLPEVGDEVVLGFLNEDPRYPIILGSMYSNSKMVPFTGLTPQSNNALKAIVSKSGIYIQFDDDKKILTIATPDKNTIIFSDADKKISILDDNSNTVVMSASGIAMNSNKDINITANQKLVLNGVQGVQIQSTGGDVQLNGMNIKESADMQYSAQGGETAQINAGMELTLKGAMVMIN